MSIAINRGTDDRAESNWSMCVVSAGASDPNTAARAAIYVQQALRRDYDLMPDCGCDCLSLDAGGRKRTTQYSATRDRVAFAVVLLPLGEQLVPNTTYGPGDFAGSFEAYIGGSARIRSAQQRAPD